MLFQNVIVDVIVGVDFKQKAVKILRVVVVPEVRVFVIEHRQNRVARVSGKAAVYRNVTARV